MGLCFYSKLNKKLLCISPTDVTSREVLIRCIGDVNTTEQVKYLNYQYFFPVPQSEDCLSLNVYTPAKATPSDKFAVMVWIHGGAFVLGAARGYDPSVLVAFHDVVVVTVNYRLGVLGFFNIPGSDVKGNYGMHDQVCCDRLI